MMAGQIKFLHLNKLTIFFLLSLLLLSTQNTYAQCENVPSIDSARGAEGNNSFFVSFDFNTDWSDRHSDLVDKARTNTNWIVFSPTLLQKAKAETDPDRKAEFFKAATPDIESIELNGNRALKITFPASLTLKKDETYMVNVTAANGFIPADCIGVAKPIKISAKPSSVPTQSGQATNTTGKRIVIAPVAERENADIYIEGNMEGARKAKAAFTVDASISKKFFLRKTTRNSFWKPFFNIKASTSEDADPDSLNFGVELENPTKRLPQNSFGITRFRFSEAAKFEADRDFKNVNFVGDFRMKITSRRLNRKLFNAIPINIVPFIGMEIGKNLKSPLDEAEGKLIARPLFGATLYARLYAFDNENGGYQKTLAFETRYERRFLLKREIALDTDDDGNFIGVPLTRAPRDYIKSSLTYDFAKNFGFKLNYEYGSLPPLFKLVDNKFSLGLVFKGVFDEK